MNPLKSGTPEIENAPTVYNTNTSGMLAPIPPSSVSFRFPVAWRAAPAPMRSSAL